MTGKFDQRGKETPTEEDMPDVWRALSRSERMWPIVAPFVAVKDYWPAWFIIAGIVAVIRGPEIIDVIQVWLEVAS